MDRRNHTKQEYASLTCNLDVVNGPQLENFEWKKNGKTILTSNSSTSPLTLFTTKLENPFGEFECLVNNGFRENNEVILISEKGKVTNKCEYVCLLQTINVISCAVLIIYILRPVMNASCVS